MAFEDLPLVSCQLVDPTSYISIDSEINAPRDRHSEQELTGCISESERNQFSNGHGSTCLPYKSQVSWPLQTPDCFLVLQEALRR